MGAITALMSRYSPRVWKVVIANSRQRRDAEEILMDIWRAVWENISGLRNVESFGAWLQLNFEGQRRAEQAETGLQKLQENADSVLVMPNQRLLDRIEQQLKIREAFRLSDEMMLGGVEMMLRGTTSILEFHSNPMSL